MKYAKIISSGMYVPKKVMTNAEFEKLTMFTIDPYFSDVIGINHRHISEGVGDSYLHGLQKQLKRHLLELV